jgi:hypothetical protein
MYGLVYSDFSLIQHLSNQTKMPGRASYTYYSCDANYRSNDWPHDVPDSQIVLCLAQFEPQLSTSVFLVQRHTLGMQAHGVVYLHFTDLLYTDSWPGVDDSMVNNR